MGINVDEAKSLAQWYCKDCDTNALIITDKYKRGRRNNSTIQRKDSIKKYPLAVGGTVFLLGKQFRYLTYFSSGIPLGKISKITKPICTISHRDKILKVHIDNCRPAIPVSSHDIRRRDCLEVLVASNPKINGSLGTEVSYFDSTTFPFYPEVTAYQSTRIRGDVAAIRKSPCSKRLTYPVKGSIIGIMSISPVIFRDTVNNFYVGPHYFSEDE